MSNYIDAEGVAKNINEALEVAIGNALSNLNVPREEVTYELLEKGKAGFLGLGGVWAKVRVYYEVGKKQKAEVFLSGLFKLMNVNADIESKEEEDGRISITLKGEEMGLLIGRRGETLDALQYITGLAVNKNEEAFTRISIDTENYREKREEALEKLAKKVAEKVVKNRRSMTLEPMAPHERRIIHACLQDYEGVTTYSTGQDPNRRVVIALKNGDGQQKSSQRQNGRYNRRPRQNAPAKNVKTAAAEAAQTQPAQGNNK